MVISVLVNGAGGRMGREVCLAIENDAELHLVGTAEHMDDLAEKISETNAQVVVDFTNADVAFDNMTTILNAGAHPVVGTSGFLPEQISRLQEHCTEQQLGAIIAPNFSIAAVLMMKYAQDAARYYTHLEIIEMHHDGKLDSPSGTAIKTAEMISENRAERSARLEDKAVIPGARGALHEDIPIHSIRLPGLVAHQQILFGGLAETLSIRHDTIHRSSFMPGVVLACKKVTYLKELVYGLEHIL